MTQNDAKNIRALAENLFSEMERPRDITDPVYDRVKSINLTRMANGYISLSMNIRRTLNLGMEDHY